MLAFTSFERSDSDVGSRLLGGCILTVFIILPLFYARLLLKNEKKLVHRETSEKYGILFDGLTTVNDLNKTSKR